MAVSAKGLAVLWAEYRDLPTEGGVDAAAAGFADMQFAGLSQQWDSPLGIVEGAPDRRRGAMSTPGGSFMAALIRRAGDADIGLMNKGGLRTALAAGEITRRQVFEFAPFDNTVVTMELTGDELAALLAAGLVRGRQPLEIDGAHYRYEVKGGERRLLDIRVGGEPLEPSSRYRVATNSFLAGGGDGMVGLRDKKRLTEKQLFLRDLIVAHLGETGKITLPADNRIRANGH